MVHYNIIVCYKLCVLTSLGTLLVIVADLSRVIGPIIGTLEHDQVEALVLALLIRCDVLVAALLDVVGVLMALGAGYLVLVLHRSCHNVEYVLVVAAISVVAAVP